jgi:hypothetical protein
MAISTKTVFHFSSLENILSILKSKSFRICYSKESFHFRPELSTFYFPMVCFCDIPLTMTKDHIQDYDGFAIGLKKDWAIAHGLNPVFYFSEMGLTVTLEKLSYGANRDINGKTGFEHIFCFLKPIKGIDHKRQNMKYFYNEREWRYVPMLSLYDDAYNQYYNEKDYPAGLNEKIIGHRLYNLPFRVSDVEYLIVKSTDRKKDLVDFLRESDYSEAIIQNDIRIFSMEEVFENF